MTIKTFSVGYLQTNCYIITEENQSQAVIIDPGGGYDKITKYLNDNNKIASAVLLTHGHFDHCMAAKSLQEMGAKVYIHEFDEELLQKKHGLGRPFGISLPPIKADYLFKDNDQIKIGELEFKVIHTPGHSKGSSCFVIQNCIFSGDTLFFESYGRTDFEGGSFLDIKQSIDKLFMIEGDFNVYPGHMEQTTLNHEREYNPI